MNNFKYQLAYRELLSQIELAFDTLDYAKNVKDIELKDNAIQKVIEDLQYGLKKAEKEVGNVDEEVEDLKEDLDIED